MLVFYKCIYLNYYIYIRINLGISIISETLKFRLEISQPTIIYNRSILV